MTDRITAADVLRSMAENADQFDDVAVVFRAGDGNGRVAIGVTASDMTEYELLGLLDHAKHLLRESLGGGSTAPGAAPSACH